MFNGILLKLLHINVFTALFLEDYSGPQLKDDINAGKFAEVKFDNSFQYDIILIFKKKIKSLILKMNNVSKF